MDVDCCDSSAIRLHLFSLEYPNPAPGDTNNPPGKEERMGIGTQDQKCETCQSCDCFYCQLREYPEGAQLLKLAEIVQM